MNVLFLKEGDQSSASDAHSVVCNNKNNFSAPFLAGLDLTSTDLIHSKLHLSITYNLIDFPGQVQTGTNNTSAPIFKNAISYMFMKGALNSTAGWVNTAANNHRLVGNHVQGADVGTALNVTDIVTNGMQQGAAKLAGTLGSSVEYAETITLGTTMDFIYNTNSFWVGSPGQNPNTPFGLTTGDSVNQSTTWNQTTIINKSNIILKLLQFEIRTAEGSLIIDQVKISTGAYENTVASGDSDCTAGLNDSTISEFTYYPNPVNDQLTISAQSYVKNITVFNMLGQVVLRQSPNTKDCLVDMAVVQSGAYFVQISIGNTVETVRVLKQ